MLGFTDALTRNNAVPDTVYSELKNHFGEPEIVKLTFTVGQAGMVNRRHAAFKTDVDEATVAAAAETPFCVLPGN